MIRTLILPFGLFCFFGHSACKSGFKIGLYTLSSFLGFRKQQNTWEMLMNPARYFGATPYPE
jgi:hypothetical protein